MKRQWQVGERFRVANHVKGNEDVEGKCATVMWAGKEGHYNILYDGDTETGGWYDEGDMELISDRKGIMQTLSAMAKRLLDKDTKTLIKAGYLSTDLSITEKGIKHINAFLFDKFKSDIVKVAEEVIAEEEKDKE